MWQTVRNLVHATSYSDRIGKVVGTNVSDWRRLWRGVQTMIKQRYTNDDDDQGHVTMFSSLLAGGAAMVDRDVIMTPAATIKQRIRLSGGERCRSVSKVFK